MTPSGPLWALSVNGLLYTLTPFSFDSGTVGDHFTVAVAIKAQETDLSYPAVGLSDYSGMMPIATFSCQLVVATHRPLVRCLQYLL